MALIAFATGLPAAAAPHAFYLGFPWNTHWIKLLPPYNEHLITDIGGLYLGFAVLFAWAAASLEPTLVRAAAVAWLLVVVLHLGFHATHLSKFDTADAIGQLTSLALLLVPALIAVWAGGRPENT